MTDALILAEDRIGKHMALEAHLQPCILEVGYVDVLASQAFAEVVPLQDDLLAVIRKSELITDVTLLTVTQDIGEPTCWDVERTMQITGSGGGNGEPFVATANEPRQKRCA